MGPITHNWDWGNRYVELAFEAQPADGVWRTKRAAHVARAAERTQEYELTVAAPAAPGLAIPGFYLLFVVDEAGVPSIARRVQLRRRSEDEER
jgi:hypothetical protein